MKTLGKLLIEVLLNMSEHGTESNGAKDGVFLIGFEKGKVFIEAGNPVEAKKLDSFRELLDQALSQSDDEINEKLEATILNSIGQNSNLTGGTGILEIVKSTSQPLNYNFNRSRDGRVFFSLRATV